MSRYERLMTEIIRQGVKTKVLLLSATPVNTGLSDLRNQLYFLTEGRDDAFREGIGITSLKETLAAAPQDRHVVLRWRAQLYDQIREANQQSGTQSGPVAFVPTGDVRALLVFADDIYQVEHAFKTPKKIVRRLRDHEQSQGARYEILTASTFARCGLDIEFIDDKTKKMPEFFATKRAPLERFAAEAKSRHRAGILHHPGSPSEAVALKGDVEGLLREALEQNPGGMPFFVFIDLNLPLTPGIPTELKPWFKDLKDIFDRINVFVMAPTIFGSCLSAAGGSLVRGLRCSLRIVRLSENFAQRLCDVVYVAAVGTEKQASTVNHALQGLYGDTVRNQFFEKKTAMLLCKRVKYRIKNPRTGEVLHANRTLPHQQI
jgi:hypothetical protein